MPIVRALACDASDYSVIQQAYDSIQVCMSNVRYHTDVDVQDCLMTNKVSTSCSVCAANAAQSVLDCLITCDYEGPNCVKCLNENRDNYDISGDPVVCGITKNLLPPALLSMFENDKIAAAYARFNVSTELGTPPPLPMKKAFSPSAAVVADTPLPVRADDTITTTSSRASFSPRRRQAWAAAIMTTLALFSIL